MTEEQINTKVLPWHSRLIWDQQNANLEDIRRELYKLQASIESPMEQLVMNTDHGGLGSILMATREEL